MSDAAKALLFLVSCVLTDNFFFTRALGERAALRGAGEMSATVLMGGAVALVMAVSSVAASALYRFALVPLRLEYLYTVLAFGVVAGALFLVLNALKRKNPLNLEQPAALHGLIAVSSAALGAALIGAGAEYDFLYGALGGVFGGLGFWLAVVLMAGVRERVALSDVPESLKGLPISLISAGLIALAFLGFSGFARSLAW